MIKKIKAYLPKFALNIIYSFLHNFRIIYYKGKKFTCPICNYQASSFLAYGTDNEAIKKYKIIPMGYRKNVLCPKCYSKDRERLIYLFIKTLLNNKLLNYNSKIIHFAPEIAIEKNFFRKNFNNYLTADIASDKVDFNLDLQNFNFTQSNFDLVICNHVLEHIEDDVKALENIFNLLKPGGFAILQVPFSNLIIKDFSLANLNSKKDRLKYYGQEDHVRIYSKNGFVNKIKNTGFDLKIYKSSEFYDKKNNLGLVENEEIFFATK